MQKTQSTLRTVAPHIRWILRKDMPEVLEIEKDEFQFPWTEEQFVRCLREKNCIGQVLELWDRVAGYMIYELLKTRIQLMNFAVTTPFQRRGFGRLMIEKLAGKLSSQRRRSITCEVRESNVDAQLFFKTMGFKAVGVKRDYYEDTSEDAYLFVRLYQM